MFKRKTNLILFITIILIFGFGFVFSSKADASLSDKLQGKILLQVQQHGEAWYVNPLDKQRYYLGRPQDAFGIMRELGLGISEVDYEKIVANNYHASAKLAGRIVLRVEANGEAYYIHPDTNKLFYLGRPIDAFQVMREQGLGISDRDLQKIGISDENSNLDNNDNNNSGVQNSDGFHTFTGDGVYDVAVGDRIVDPDSGGYILFTGDGVKNEKKQLFFSVYFPDGSPAYIQGAYLYLGEKDMKFGFYSPASNVGYTKDGIFDISYLGKNSNNTYSVKIDFALRSTWIQAHGNRKVLFLPIYFEDTYDQISEFPKLREYILEPAIDEIDAYLKTKQGKYIGEEILSLDFTIAEPIKDSNPDKYHTQEIYDDVKFRFDTVKEKTNYNPLDYDIVVFRLFTELYTYKYSHIAYPHQVFMVAPQESVNEKDLDRSGIHMSIYQYGNGMLHELLHNFGMSDQDHNQGKSECFVGDKYDGSQELRSDICGDIEFVQNHDENVGSFQHLDDFIAKEIGWTDRNNNGIVDAREYVVSCYPDQGEWDFCKDE